MRLWASYVTVVAACSFREVPQQNASPDAAADGTDATLIGPTCPTAPPPPPAASCANPWFAGEVTLGAPGVHYVELALGDLDGDGHLDAVNTNRDATVTVFLGRGNARFATPSTYAVAAETHDVALGDLDNNGSLDIVVVSMPFGGGAGAISLLRNLGNGTFAPAESVATITENPHVIQVADIDRDGWLDAAILGNGAIEVFENNAGALATSTQYSIGSSFPLSPRGMTTGDVNADGRVDVVISRDGGFVDILRGRPNGFAAAERYESGVSSEAIELADVSGDGRLDVVVAGHSTTSGAGSLVVMVNTANTFPTAATYVTRARVDDLAIGDLDGDGDRDIVAGSSFIGSEHTLGIFLNTGAGALATEQSLPLHMKAIALAHLDGDGVLDLAAHQGGMLGLRGLGNGTFDIGVAAPVWPRWSADLDANGRSELLGTYAGDQYGLWVAFSNLDGTFGAPAGYALGQYFQGIAMHDLDGDGIADAVAWSYLGRATTSSVFVFRGQPDGTSGAFDLTGRYATLGATASAVAFGDVTGDCVPDIVVANAGWSDSFHHVNYPGSLDLLRNHGDGTFAQAVRIGDAAAAVGLGDLDGDRWADLVVERKGQVEIHRGVGLGQFASPVTLGMGTLRRVADVSGDGVLDILANGVYLGTGVGTFPTYLATPTPRWLADLDGDGDLDGTGDNSVLYGYGDGTFREVPLVFMTGPMGDVDGDGRLDIAGPRILRQRCL